MTGDRATPIRVLFVCTGNSARSIMAEALLRQHGGDAFEVHSAGTEPRGINPLTLRVLAEAGIDASWARSKSVDEYLGQTFDYVVTVCDQARQVCPVFPGVHESLHWGYEDPAAAEGTEEERLAVFRKVFIQIGERVRQFATVDRQPRSPPDAARTCCATPTPGDPRRGTGPDAARPLSDKGRTQSERLGRVPGRASGSRPTPSSPRPSCGRRRRPRSSREHLGIAVTEDERLAGAVRPRDRRRDPARRRRPRAADAGRSRPGLQRPHRRCCAAPSASRCARARSRGSRSIGRSQAGGGTLRWLIPPDALKPKR